VNGLNVTKESAPQTQDWERGQVKFLSVRTSLTKRSGDMVTSPCWTGEFLLENKRYCYPLTVSDYGSRYLLLCEAMESFKEQGAFTAFERLFKERGLPQAIRSDNGVPFASPHGLFHWSRLAVWWLRPYPFHDRTVLVTCCGRICIFKKEINLSTSLAGQAVGIKEVDDGIWLVSSMDYDLGYIDLGEKTLQPLDNPFGPKVM
jgi:hypothetical protein